MLAGSSVKVGDQASVRSEKLFAESVRVRNRIAARELDIKKYNRWEGRWGVSIWWWW